MRIVLDTSAYSHLRGNHDDVVSLIAAADAVSVPAVVIGELEAAFRLGRRAVDNRAVLEEFLAEDFVDVVPVTPDVGRRYGGLFAALRTAGTPIPVNDIWIAASTLEAAGHLVTFDRDFERIEGLELTLLDP